MSKTVSCVLLLGVFAVFGCGSFEPPSWQSGAPPEEDGTADAWASRAVELTESGYFPGFQVDEFLDEWYTKHLSAAAEEPLFASSASTSYRLIFLPSFHRPLIVRARKHDSAVVVVAKELDGAGGYDPGSILVERHRRLKQEEWDRLEGEIQSMRFWQTPVHACGGRSHHNDGAVWILEGKRGNEYWLAQWHWPECSVCQLMLELSELELPTGYGLPIETERPYPPPPPLPPLRPWG